MNKIIMCNLKNHEKHDYNLDLDWLTILYKSRVAHPRRSKLAEKVTIQDPSYLNECLGVVESCASHPQSCETHAKCLFVIWGTLTLRNPPHVFWSALCYGQGMMFLQPIRATRIYPWTFKNAFMEVHYVIGEAWETSIVRNKDLPEGGSSSVGGLISNNALSWGPYNR